MKILHIYKCALPDAVGGVEVVIDNLASGQIEAGHEVNVLAISKYGALGRKTYNGYNVTFVKQDFFLSSTPFSVSFFLELRKLCEWCDIINMHAPYPFADLCLLFAGRKKPIVITYHSDIIRQNFLRILYSPIMHLFFKRADKVIATSPNYVKTSPVLPKYGDKLCVIPLGSPDYSEFRDSPISGFDTDEQYVLFLGEFRYYKGLFTLVRAAGLTNHRIVIAGSGLLEKKLKSEVKRKALENVQFVGRISFEEKLFLIRNAYAIVFPSTLRSEAFGMTLVEGAMFSKPLISCEIGSGTSFVNIDKETGIVTEPDNHHQLAEAINLLAAKQSLAKHYGNASRERYRSLFIVEKMLTDYEKVYRAALIVKNIV